MLLTTLLALLQSAAPVPLQPSAKWNLEYADEMCFLSRNYGTVAKPLLFGFKPAPMADGLQMLIISQERASASKAGQAQVEVNDTIFSDAYYYSYSTARTGKRVTAIGVYRSSLAGLAKQGRIAVRTSTKKGYAFAISQFDVAMRGLADCETNLLKSWGMTDAELDSIAVKPKPIGNLASYISDYDYPDAAIRAGHHGASGVRFTVGPDGLASECHVVETSGSSLLDETTCRILTARARFEPALDKTGKPVSSRYLTRIRWRLG